MEFKKIEKIFKGWNKKRVTVVAAGICCIAILTGGTLAYFTAEETAYNVITTGNLDLILHDETTGGVPFPEEGIHDVVPGNVVDKVVYIENGGSVDFYTRISLDKIIQTATSTAGYTGVGDYNRLTAIPRVWTEFLNSGYRKLFGLGLGNCDGGFTDALTPAFYYDNYHLHYILFLSGFILLETGLVGSLLYLAFYPGVFLLAHHLERSGKADPVFCQIGKIMAFYSLVLYIYNSSLRSEDGYLIFFSLALPFLGTVKNAKQ